MDTILKEVEKSKNVVAKSLQKSAEQIVIEETDLYVRFLPKDSLELNILEKDSTLVLFDYPLDHEIEQDGEHYHDPELPEDQISWRYTVVKPDYQFPEEIEHEILSDLFIPENHPSYTIEEGEKSNTFNKKVTLDNLETVSLYLTGNLSEKELSELKEQSKLAKGRECVRILWMTYCWNTPDLGIHRVLLSYGMTD